MQARGVSQPLLAANEWLLRSLSLILVVVVALAGCVGGSGPTIEAHGRFCGPNHPKLPTGIDRAGAIQYLSAIEPIDDLDRECKRHDMCYAQLGGHNYECDARINTAFLHFSSTDACQAKAKSLRAAFFLKPSYPSVEGRSFQEQLSIVSTSAGGVTGGAVAHIIAAPFTAANLLSGSGQQLCNGYFDEAAIARSERNQRSWARHMFSTQPVDEQRGLRWR